MLFLSVDLLNNFEYMNDVDGLIVLDINGSQVFMKIVDFCFEGFTGNFMFLEDVLQFALKGKLFFS